MQILTSTDPDLSHLRPSIHVLLELHTRQMSYITGDNRDEMITDWFNEYRLPNYFMVENDAVIGLCITDTYMNTGREISLLLTHPSYYRQSVATSLLEHCIRRSEFCGFTSLHLQVARDNENAIRLYYKHGFILADKTGHMYKMSRSLSSNDCCSNF